jgi:hypothetical protein
LISSVAGEFSLSPRVALRLFSLASAFAVVRFDGAMMWLVFCFAVTFFFFGRLKGVLGKFFFTPRPPF